MDNFLRIPLADDPATHERLLAEKAKREAVCVASEFVDAEVRVDSSIFENLFAPPRLARRCIIMRPTHEIHMNVLLYDDAKGKIDAALYSLQLFSNSCRCRRVAHIQIILSIIIINTMYDSSYYFCCCCCCCCCCLMTYKLC